MSVCQWPLRRPWPGRTAEATTAEPGFRRVGNNRILSSRMEPGSWHTAVRNTARSKGTAWWKDRGAGRNKDKISCYERSLCPGQAVLPCSHFHLCLSTRLSSPDLNQQRKAKGNFCSRQLRCLCVKLTWHKMKADIWCFLSFSVKPIEKQVSISPSQSKAEVAWII